MIRRGKAVLVTDADHGVGRATAVWLGERGFRVLAGGRALDAMADLPRETSTGGMIEITALDPRDEGSCTRALDHLLEVYSEVNGVVCSGGHARFGPVEETSEATLRALFEDNFFGPWRLIRQVAPRLREQGQGTIVCVSSAAGRVGLPMSGAYSASRFAIEGLCDALRLELAVFGVGVVLVEPGVVRHRVGAAGTPGDWDAERLFGVAPESPYRAVAETLADTILQLLPRAATPQDVARVIDKALRAPRPKARYAVSRGAAALLWARRLLPDRLLDRRLARAAGMPLGQRTARSSSSPKRSR